MIKVNLLSPGKKEVTPGAEPTAFIDEERESKINTGAILAAVLLTVGIIGFLYFSQSSTLNNKKRELEEKRARKAELDVVLKTITQLEKTKARLDRKVKIISELKSRQHGAVRMMDEVSKAMPDMVWLTKLNFNNNLLKIEGVALNNELIANFINSLKASHYFYNEKFDGSNRKAKGGVDIFQFKLSFAFDNNAAKKKVM